MTLQTKPFRRKPDAQDQGLRPSPALRTTNMRGHSGTP